MTSVRDEARQVFTPVRPCKQCQASVYLSLTGRGTQALFNIDADGNPTRVLHSSTCLASPWNQKRVPS